MHTDVAANTSQAARRHTDASADTVRELCLLFAICREGAQKKVTKAAQAAPRFEYDLTSDLPPPQRFQRRKPIIDTPPSGPS